MDKRIKLKSFTLIETLIAIVVISITIASTFSMINISDKVFMKNIDRENINSTLYNIFEDIESDKSNIDSWGAFSSNETEIDILEETNPNMRFLEDWKSDLIQQNAKSVVMKVIKTNPASGSVLFDNLMLFSIEIIVTIETANPFETKDITITLKREINV